MEQNISAATHGCCFLFFFSFSLKLSARGEACPEQIWLQFIFCSLLKMTLTALWLQMTSVCSVHRVHRIIECVCESGTQTLSHTFHISGSGDNNEKMIFILRSGRFKFASPSWPPSRSVATRAASQRRTWVSREETVFVCLCRAQAH